jgi:hypothetical protein
MTTETKKSDQTELLAEEKEHRAIQNEDGLLVRRLITKPKINIPKVVTIQTMAVVASAASLPLTIIGSKQSLETLISGVTTNFLINWWVGSESFGLDYSQYSKIRLGIALPGAILITLPYGASTYLLADSYKLLQGSADFAGNFSFNYYALVVIDYKKIVYCALLPLATTLTFLRHLVIYRSLTDPSYYLYKARYNLLDNLKFALRDTEPDTNHISNFFLADKYSLSAVLQALIDSENFSDNNLDTPCQTKLWIAFKESTAWSFGLWLAILAIEISCAAAEMFHVIGIESNVIANILGQIVNLPNCVLSLKCGVAIAGEALDGIKDLTERKFTAPALWKLNAVVFLLMHVLGILIPSRSGETAVLIFEEFCPNKWINDFTINNVRTGNLIFNWYFLNKTLNTLIDTLYVFNGNEQNSSYKLMTGFLEKAYADISYASAQELVTIITKFPKQDAQKLIGVKTYNQLSHYNFFNGQPPSPESLEMKQSQEEKDLCSFTYN